MMVHSKNQGKKVLKKPTNSLKLSIRWTGGPWMWAVMLYRCLAIQVKLKGILSLTHTRDPGLKPAPENSAPQCFSHVTETSFGSLFDYDDSSSQIKDQDPVPHAESKFILPPCFPNDILVWVIYSVPWPEGRTLSWKFLKPSASIEHPLNLFIHVLVE